jgi:lipopolysaccharide export system protein LptA
MRHTWPLFLLAIVLVIAGVGTTYYERLKQQYRNAPAKPKALAPGTEASYHGWTYTHTSNQNTVIKVSAADVIEINGKEHLTGVQLDIYKKDSDQYDHVTCDKAEFQISDGTLYSDGDVTITLGMKPNEPPSGRLMSIKSSGVRVESKTGKATTDRLATFQFDRGDGHAVGADYDPDSGELTMHSQVELIWRGTDPKTVPMKVETENLDYKERDHKVFLSPWSKLTRDTLTLNAGPAQVTLDQGSLKQVDTTQAHGTDQRPGRTLDYSANQLSLEFNDNNQIQKITGTDQARLTNTADTTTTTLNGDRVVMDFDTSGNDSLLENAVVSGHGIMESKPVIKPGVDASDTRILKSDVIRAKMRPGGQDLESVQTDSAAAIEFVPNRPDQPHRWMNGDRIAIAYAPKNQIQSFHSSAVTTRTEKPKPKDAKETPAPELTWSNEIEATFQPNSSQIAKMEQQGNFRYQEGDRHAKADRAALDQANNRIDLIGSARIWDSTGSADADKILMDQMTGDFSAEGHVISTRMPDKSNNKDAQGGGMLSEDEPLHARAAKMVSTDNNLQIRYEGQAVLWQGADRLEADVVEIDRENSRLKARGHVVSQLLDKAKDDTDSSKSGKGEPQATAGPAETASGSKAAPGSAAGSKTAMGPAGSAKPAAASSAKSKTAAAEPAAGKSGTKSAGNKVTANSQAAGKPATSQAASSPPAAGKRATDQAAPVFTIVRAPVLDYDDTKRIADYKEGVTLERMNMRVKAREIHAFLRNDSNDSSLDHAIAEGAVEVVQIVPARTRNGKAEHAEYYPDEDKVILEGGKPQFVDSIKGMTQGDKLTWFSNEDRLLVNGVPGGPAKSLLHRKTNK